MSIAQELRALLAASEATNRQHELSGALAEAERLTDLFDEVVPQPYIVPMERFAGIPVCNRDQAREIASRSSFGILRTAHEHWK